MGWHIVGALRRVREHRIAIRDLPRHESLEIVHDLGIGIFANYQRRAGVDAIYVTPYRRTQETARPIADKLDLPINVYDVANTEMVLETILKKHKGKIVLVIGHSNTIPVLIANLGASKKVPEIAENEYDNIYIISIPWFGKTKTIRLRYGTPYLADDRQAVPAL